MRNKPAFESLLLALVVVSDVIALPSEIRIGGLFRPEDEQQKIAFRYAVDRVNLDTSILPRSRLSAQIRKIHAQDSFNASKEVCGLLRMGVVGIFGPMSGPSATHVRSICDTMEIPHIETRWDTNANTKSSTLNLYPPPSLISRAYVDLVREWGWNGFTVIYENDEGLVRLQDLLKAHGPSDAPVTVRQLSESGDYRPMLKQIKNSVDFRIVLDCNTDKIQDVLRQAKEVDLMTYHYSYLITSLDISSVDLDEFKSGRTNITAFRLVDPEKPEVQGAVRDWIYGELRQHRKLDLLPESLKIETALMYDAVILFAKALHDVDSTQRINVKQLTCDGLETWQYGYNLIAYMKIIETKELTGLVKFDNEGLRTDITLDIVELSESGLIKIGFWQSQSGINITRSFGETLSQIKKDLEGRTLIVTSKLSSPYFMYKNEEDRESENDIFEGYCVDLIDEVARKLDFNYVFKQVDDNSYGNYIKETKQWNGMIGELLDQTADLAIGDLTITYSREQTVDFTMPFMNLGISILYKKPKKSPPNLFSFLSPFSVEVWIYMATAYLGVSVLLFILARFTPYEWENPHPCNSDPDHLENQFNLLNCMWFAIGSLMQQGCDFLPKAVSTRMVAGMWWFFTLIMISSYTANLAAFLTLDRMDTLIESVEDLAKQTKVKYGAVLGGSTAGFIRDSNFSTYQRMWSFMESARPSVFTQSNGEGVERVIKMNGNYAFFMESTSIEYQTERTCDLTQVGGLLDSKGYGIAMAPNSPFRTAISGAVLQLQEEGKLHILKIRWWKEKHGGGNCTTGASKSGAAASELGLANVGGVFVVLVGGMVAACLISVFEFVWKTRKVAVEERLDLAEELKEELKFALLCRGSTKPVRKKQEENDNEYVPVNSFRDFGFSKEALNGKT